MGRKKLKALETDRVVNSEGVTIGTGDSVEKEDNEGESTEKEGEGGVGFEWESYETECFVEGERTGKGDREEEPIFEKSPQRGKRVFSRTENVPVELVGGCKRRGKEDHTKNEQSQSGNASANVIQCPRNHQKDMRKAPPRLDDRSEKVKYKMMVCLESIARLQSEHVQIERQRAEWQEVKVEMKRQKVEIERQKFEWEKEKWEQTEARRTQEQEKDRKLRFIEAVLKNQSMSEDAIIRIWDRLQ